MIGSTNPVRVLDGCAPLGPLLTEPQLLKAVVTDAEVVGKLVEDRLANLVADFVVGLADGLDGLLVDGDLVGRDEVVVLASPGEGYAVVEAQKGTAGADPGKLAIAGGRPPFDDDIDVMDAA